MLNLDCADVRIMDRTFKIFGHADDRWFQSLKANGQHTEFDHSKLRHIIKDGDICLDLGANLGTMTLAIAMATPAGHVYAYEASQETTEALKQTIRANGLINATAFAAAVGRPDQLMKFFDVPRMRAGGHCVPDDDDHNRSIHEPETARMYEVRTKSVDQIVAELGLSRVDFIKIDVEGAELDVLDGARDTLMRFKPTVMMEFNSFAFLMIREIVPRHALKKIMAIFDKVYYFENRNGDLMQLAKTEDNLERFLQHNLTEGFVDDLLCAFDERNIRIDRMRPSAESSAIPLDPASPPQTEHASNKKALTALSPAEAAAEIERLRGELAAVRASTSWRITKPLRWLKGHTGNLAAG